MGSGQVVLVKRGSQEKRMGFGMHRKVPEASWMSHVDQIKYCWGGAEKTVPYVKSKGWDQWGKTWWRVGLEDGNTLLDVVWVSRWFWIARRRVRTGFSELPMFGLGLRLSLRVDKPSSFTSIFGDTLVNYMSLLHALSLELLTNVPYIGQVMNNWHTEANNMLCLGHLNHGWREQKELIVSNVSVLEWLQVLLIDL
jgi:hypothetical protein